MFSNGSIAKVWDKNPLKKKETEEVYGWNCKVSCSRRDARDGKYHQDFNHYVDFVGLAGNKMTNVPAGSIIKILSCGVENIYYAAQKRKIWYCKVFDFELYDQKDGSAENTEASAPEESKGSTAVEDSDLPF